MNSDLLESVEILSQHLVERFKQLRDNDQYEDADAIASEYICEGDEDIEDDDYQWYFANYQFGVKE